MAWSKVTALSGPLWFIYFFWMKFGNPTAKSLLTTRSVKLLLRRRCSLQESWRRGGRRLILCSMISSAQVPGQTKQLMLCCCAWLISSRPSTASEAKKRLAKKVCPNHPRARGTLIVTPPFLHIITLCRARKIRTCGSEAFLFALDRQTTSFASFLHACAHTLTLPLWAQMLSLYLSGLGPEPAAYSAVLMPFCLFFLPPSAARCCI